MLWQRWRFTRAPGRIHARHDDALHRIRNLEPATDLPHRQAERHVRRRGFWNARTGAIIEGIAIGIVPRRPFGELHVDGEATRVT